MSLFNSFIDAPIALSDILLIEDTPEILDFRCPLSSILVWPNVRLLFLRTIMGDLLYSSSNSMDFPILGNSCKAVSSLTRAFLHNGSMAIGRSMCADILLKTEGVGDEWTGAAWFNRYADPFVTAAEARTTVLLDMFEWNWNEPRCAPQSYYHAPIQAVSALRGRQSSTAAKFQATALVDLLERRALEILGWKLSAERRNYLYKTFAAKITGLPYQDSAYRKLLQRVKPKLLLGSSGCYGNHAPLWLAANEMGIVTAEYQHGAISQGHDAYNYSATIVASEAYRQYFPKYLLSYGDWWNEQVNVPVEKISIGYPSREEKLTQITQQDCSLQRNILLLGDGVEFELYLKLAQDIAAALDATDLRVVIRPHPLERTAVIARWGQNVGKVCIDTNANIYTAFSEAHTVISEVSTGLFEAVGLAKRVIIIGSKKSRFCFPESPFAISNSVQEIVSIVLGSETAPSGQSENRIWAPNWRENFREFFREKVK
jgi:hypothetical protein